VVVVKFSENTVVLHTQIKTLPGRQWTVAPAFNLRLKRRFDQLRITMYPSRKIYLSPELQRVDGGPSRLLDGMAPAVMNAAEQSQ
jgi:hypothetical protein